MNKSTCRKINLCIKRTADVIISFLCILLLFIIPVFEIVYLTIKLTSKGPALFKQTRIGKDKKPFVMYKFRTMIVEQYDKKGNEIMSEDRITSIGKILRKTSLDELPQLFNVLNGTMSIIGPRPMLDYQAERCDAKESRRFYMRPGITGLAQAKGRNNIQWPERIKYDIEYIKKFSVFLDIKIVIMTIATVLKRDGTDVKVEYRGIDKFSKHYITKESDLEKNKKIKNISGDEMENEVMVSVICNAYNQEKYIKSALNGFVKQKTNFRFEVLIHDDASTDSTAEIIKKYEARYPDIIIPIYESENQYSKHDGTIRKLQGERVKGKYVAFCEGDDYWTDPLKLQKQFDFMESHPEYTLCGCSTRWINMLKMRETGQGRTDHDKDVSLEDFLIPKNGRPFPFVSFFMRSDIWRSIPKWGFPVGDLPTTYYSAMRGKVRMLSDVMCVYRWNIEGSWTARNSDPADRAASSEKMIAGFERMNKETNYEYNAVISKAILNQKYTLALMNNDFKTLTSPELRPIYLKRDFIHRLSDRTRCKLPKVYRIVQRFVGRNR